MSYLDSVPVDCLCQSGWCRLQIHEVDLETVPDLFKAAVRPPVVIPLQSLYGQIDVGPNMESRLRRKRSKEQDTTDTEPCLQDSCGFSGDPQPPFAACQHGSRFVFILPTCQIAIAPSFSR
jgi:hypothetical protein